MIILFKYYADIENCECSIYIYIYQTIREREVHLWCFTFLKKMKLKSCKHHSFEKVGNKKEERKKEKNKKLVQYV